MLITLFIPEDEKCNAGAKILVIPVQNIQCISHDIKNKSTVVYINNEFSNRVESKRILVTNDFLALRAEWHNKLQEYYRAITPETTDILL